MLDENERPRITEFHFPISDRNKVYIIFEAYPTEHEILIVRKALDLLEESIGGRSFIAESAMPNALVLACSKHPKARISLKDGLCTRCKAEQTRETNRKLEIEKARKLLARVESKTVESVPVDHGIQN